MAASEVEGVFDELDRRFSLYRDDSELNRIAARQLRLVDASEELREAYATAIAWRRETRGVFTPHRPDGVIDLSGVVKAMASAKDGYPHVAELYRHEVLDPAKQGERDAKWGSFVRLLEDDLCASIHEINRLTPTIIEVIVKAPRAARCCRCSP